jgi:hypothetical protein
LISTLLNPKITMFTKLRPSAKSRILTSRLSSLILLFQRSPLVQMLFPEARIIGAAGLGEITKWSVATIAGLGAFDSVAGATSIIQLQPSRNSLTVPATSGSALVFRFQVIGAPSAPEAWTVTGTIPNGLTHTDTQTSTNSITGVPTQTGRFPITVTAWRFASKMGDHYSQSFTINVVAGASTIPAISSQPASVTINSGGTTILTTTASGTPAPTFQWYVGTSGSTSNPVSGATSASFTTPPLNTTTNYWARATNSAGTADTNTATITVNQPAAITTGPNPVTIDSGASTTLSVTAAGTAPLTYQWYQGASGVNTTPVGSNEATFTPNPALTATTDFWVKVTNAANSSGANSATATVTVRDLFLTWQNSVFTTPQLQDPLISGPLADPDGDGITNENEYLFGLSPLLSNPSISPRVSINAGQVDLSFTATAASGSGYFGKTRHYTLQSNPTLTSSDWADVAGFSNILGADQLVNFTSPVTSGSPFYRVKVELKP